MTALALLMGLAAVPGCTADDPPPAKWDTVPAVDHYLVPDAPAGCPSPPTLAAPTLDPYPNPAPTEVVPFRGTAQGASLITARSPRGTAAPASVSSTGKFCIEVELVVGTVNRVVFTPFDVNGCPGREVAVDVTQQSQAQPDGGVTDPINVAQGRPVTSNEEPDEGSLSYVTDGDANSYVKLGFTDLELGSKCNKAAWVNVDLGEPYVVTQVKVQWPSSVGSDFAKCYAVLVSSSSAPVDPDPSASSDWQTVADTEAGTASEQVIPISPQAVRWVALLMYENDSWGWNESFKLGELEVWGQDPGASPPPPPTSCGGD